MQSEKSPQPQIQKDIYIENLWIKGRVKGRKVIK